VRDIMLNPDVVEEVAFEISTFWHQVNNALVKLHRQYVQMPPKDAPTPTKIQGNTRWWPYFDDCIGAVDDTLIEACIGGDDKDFNGIESWRCRKGYLCQNVLAAVDFDMNFHLCMLGTKDLRMTLLYIAMP
jgi:hypothetical protein